MITGVGERQQALLGLLLRHKEGLTMDELVDALGVTRTAVRQHLATLERDGFVRRGELRRTSGRPGATFVLTPAAAERFPRQYAWFSALLLEALRRDRGSAGLEAWLRELAAPIAASLRPRLEGKPAAERGAEIIAILNELGFVTRPGADGASIDAANCVYHQVAERFPELCQFDLALLAGLAGTMPEHPICMVRGGHVCRFAWPGR